MRELEIRAGPPAGAHWRLQTVPEYGAVDSAVFTIEFPSGVEEILELRLKPDGDGEGWKIHAVGVSTDPAPGVEAVATAGAVVEPPDREPLLGMDQALPAAAIVVLLVLLVVSWRRDASWLLRLALIAGLAAAIFVLVRDFPRLLGGGASAPQTAGETEKTDAARLLALRRAVASAERLALEAARAELGSQGSANPLVQLWEAQLLLNKLRLNEAEKILAALPRGQSGRSELVRARIGLLRMNAVDAVSAYERAVEVLPLHDGLRHEAARACELLGFPGRAASYYDELAGLGSRQAALYYQLSQRDLIDDRWTRAAEHFETAWRLQPWRREEILARPVLVFLLEQRSDLLKLLELASASEAKVHCQGISEEAITISDTQEASLIGSLLVIESPGGGELEVPGGCRLAPPGTEVFDAGSWQEQRDQQVLARLVAPQDAGEPAASRPPPRRLPEAVDALMRKGRWDEVVRLTENLSDELSQALPGLTRSGRKPSAGPAVRTPRAGS